MSRPAARQRRVCLTVLGGFQLLAEDGHPVVLPTRKSQALLAYLALASGSASSREGLATLLWGDVSDPQARASVRGALYRIRKSLNGASESVLLVDGETVGLRADALTVDAVTFERLCGDGSPSALVQAVELYRGDLLAGLTIDTSPFEEWLMVQRERLRELALQALARLLTHQREQGATEAAVQTALRLLAMDPAREPVHRILMRLYMTLGRRTAALRQYNLCVSALLREFHAPPSAETMRLHREIVRQRPPEDEPSAQGAPPAAVPVHGGDTLAALARGFDDVVGAHDRLTATARRHLRRAVMLARRSRGEAAHAELAAAIALFESMDLAAWLEWVERLKGWWLG